MKKGFESVEELTVFSKKKGFVFQGSQIYGGLSGTYDYGHIGTLMKKNWENAWRRYFLSLDDNFVEIEASTIMHEDVFKASGHLENFYDPIVVIEGSDETFRADHLIEDKLGVRAEELSNEEMRVKIVENKLLGDFDYSKVRVENLNLMFPVSMGPKSATKAYLRPETAQSPFISFKMEYELLRKKMPIGLAMIGRAYRNEIAPRNMLIRTRELEQAELQIFFNPNLIDEHPNFNSVEDYELIVLMCNKREKEAQKISAKVLLEYGIPKFYVYHMVLVQKFCLEIMGISEENFRFYELNSDEKAFYNKYHFDIELRLQSIGNWVELGGVHYRTDHDLSGHQKVSKENMEVFDEERGERFIPHVLELSFGVGRSVYALLDEHVYDDSDRGNIVFKVPNKLAPYQVAIFPLVNKNNIPEKAREIYEMFLEEEFSVFYDKSGSIGRRYARADEIGIPYCITIDYESLEDGELRDSITIRDRDSCKQARIKITEITELVRDLIKGRKKFEEIIK